MFHRFFLALATGLLLLTTTIGCSRRAPTVAAAGPDWFRVSKPVQRPVTDTVDFTGRTNAIGAVNVVARVTGYIIQAPFTEGSEVQKDDLLFEIDPRPYEAQLHQAEAQVTLNQAQLTLAEANYARDLALLKKNSISQLEVDQDKAALDEAKARLNATKSSLEVYNLNLEFTKVKSPINGEVSRYFLTKGNLVNQDQTLLTTVVSMDPMYAYFDVDEPTFLKIKEAVIAGKMQPLQEGKTEVYLGLQSEIGYPHKGVINFINNQVNPATGSISMRGIFPNPMVKTLTLQAASMVGLLDSSPGLGPLLIGPSMTPGVIQVKGDARLLTPGMFVRIQLPIGQPYSALLVIDRAVSSEQTNKYVYVVDADKTVKTRPVTLGPLQQDGLRVIASGLEPDDLVVVGGIQQLQPGMKIEKTELVPMESLTVSSAPTAPGAGTGKK